MTASQAACTLPKAAWYRNADTLDGQVVHFLARGLRLTDAKVRDEILSHKASSVSATYQLLLKRKQSGQGLPHFAPDIRAEKWPRLLARPVASDSAASKATHERPMRSQGGTAAVRLADSSESTEQIKVTQEANTAHPSSMEASALPSHDNRERPSLTKLSSLVSQPDANSASPNKDQFSNLPKCEMRNYTSSLTETQRLSRQKTQQTSPVPNKHQPYKKATHHQSEAGVSQSNEDNYRDYLVKLRKQKHKLYRGVLNSIGTRRLNHLPQVQGSDKDGLTFQEVEEGNNRPMEEYAYTCPMPRYKSASNKSVRFLIADEASESEQSTEPLHRGEGYPVPGSGLWTRQNMNSRTSSAQKISYNAKNQSFARTSSRAESHSRSRQNKTPVLSDSISASFSRQNSTVTLLSGKTSVTDTDNTETSLNRPISSPRQHHVFKVKDDTSNRLYSWDLGEPNLKMAGEKVIKSEDRSLPDIARSQPNSASSASRIKPSSATLLQHRNKKNWKGSSFVSPDSPEDMDMTSTDFHIHSNSTNQKLSRHRYSFMTPLSQPYQGQVAKQTSANRFQFQIRIPTGTEESSIQRPLQIH